MGAAKQLKQAAHQKQQLQGTKSKNKDVEHPLKPWVLGAMASLFAQGPVTGFSPPACPGCAAGF